MIPMAAATPASATTVASSITADRGSGPAGCPQREVDRAARREVAELRDRFGIADRRAVRFMPAADAGPAEEQLALEAFGFGEDATVGPTSQPPTDAALPRWNAPRTREQRIA